MAAKLLGAQVKRKEDPRLITGTSQYVADIALPGLLHVAFVRSPHAHANIRGIDAAAARALPGVVAVVTGRDLMPHVAPLPIAVVSAEGGGEAKSEVGRQHYPLSVDRVRHAGEAVAAVIGASPEAAADGAAAVAVDWEPLPAVVDAASAMADGAPQLFDDAPKNVEHTQAIKAGDPDAAFARAHRVVKQRMVSQRLSGVPIEGRAVLAAPDFASGGITVWSTHQAPHALRTGLAAALRLPENQIRVIAPEVGGGFGVKFGTYPEDVVVAALARQRRVPLRWIETRVEHMMTTTHGRGQITDMEAAVDADGRITGLRMHVLADIGAYPIFTFIPDLTLMMGVGVYGVKNVDLKNTCVFTNTTSIAAYRGAGRPEAAYYLERLVDVIAAELGRPPEEIRRKNFIPPAAFPYQAPTGQHYDSGEYDRALTRALEVSRYDAAPRRAAPADRGQGPAPPRHRHGLLRRDVRLRPLRERHGARRAERHRHRVHRHVAPRPGPRDHVRPDHRRSARRGVRPGDRAPRRHVDHAHGVRHRRQPEPRRGRLGHAERRGQGPGEGPPHRREHARGGLRGRGAARTAAIR